MAAQLRPSTSPPPSATECGLRTKLAMERSACARHKPQTVLYRGAPYEIDWHWKVRLKVSGVGREAAVGTQEAYVLLTRPAYVRLFARVRNHLHGT